ncbi:MAG: AMP-binding protein [Hyphomicrobiales bacterium]
MSAVGATKDEASKARACPSWGSLTFARVLEKWATTRGDTPFLLPYGGPALTFADVQNDVVRISNVMRAQGFGPGDSVLLRAGRRPEGLIMLLAAIKTGLQICLAPEGMSARQVTEGAVSYAPKLAIDAGTLCQDKADSLRILEMAANLFTIRFVGCFGEAPDGFVDLATVEAPPMDEKALPSINPDQDAVVHVLRHSADGKLERLSRTQNQLLAQALACAMISDLSINSLIGTAFDPIGAHGLLATTLPALLVGCGVQLFEAVDPSLDARMQLWLEESETHRLVLPAAFAHAVGFKTSTAGAKRVWVSNGSASHALPKGDHLLVDCGGTALLPAKQNSQGQTQMRPGAITIGPPNGAAMTFGTLRLEGGAQENSASGTLLTGKVCLDSPLVAARNGKLLDPQPTGQMARVAEDDERRPVYVLTDADAAAVQVGAHRVMLSVINRALGLTGRWQDAAVFTVPDPLMKNRIEVAVEPRAGDGEAQTLPTLAMVRSMLLESGIGDAGLPVKIHLVTRVPRRGRGLVDVAALPDHVWEAPCTAEGDEIRTQAAVA